MNALETMRFATTEIAAATTDCIIHWPSPWAADTPAWLKDAIIAERIIAVREAVTGKPLLATEAEVVFYLMPRTYDAPLDYDWAEIYLYCSARVVARHRKTPVPEDIKVKELTSDQQRLLDHYGTGFWNAVSNTGKRKDERKGVLSQKIKPLKQPYQRNKLSSIFRKKHLSQNDRPSGLALKDNENLSANKT